MFLKIRLEGVQKLLASRRVQSQVSLKTYIVYMLYKIVVLAFSGVRC